MRQLHFDLLRLLEDDRRGSHASRRARRYVLAQAAETLHGLGYRGLRARGFKGRHVDALVREWRRQGLSDGATLVIAFNEALAAAANLANGAFTVKKTPSGGSETTVALTGSPTISGSALTLTLATTVVSTDASVKASHTKPTTGTDNR